MKAMLTIFRKEIKDALRDRRTLMTALLSSLLGVPLMLFIFSTVLSQVESQEEKRTVLAVGIEYAPQLENFILRQGYQIKAAPVDYEAKSRSKELDQPVLLVPQDFEKKLMTGDKAILEVAYDSNNRQAEFGLRPLKRLLEAFTQETTLMGLTMRGISTELLQRIEVQGASFAKAGTAQSIDHGNAADDGVDGDYYRWHVCRD
jgi:sodium transport system permease protein